MDERLKKLATDMIGEFNTLEGQRPETQPDMTEEERTNALRIISAQRQILKWLTDNEIPCNGQATRTPWKTFFYLKFK